MLFNLLIKRNTYKYLNNSIINRTQCFSSESSIKTVKLAFSVYENNQKDDKSAPFLIAHGLFGSKQNWFSLCRAYTQKLNPARKIIGIDLRNHGESPHSDDHSYDSLAEDVRQFIKDHGLNKIALMGHSMGGRCAMMFALKYPELLEKVIIVDISPVLHVANHKDISLILESMKNVEMPKDVSQSQARKLVEQQLINVIFDNEIRSFILTNLIPDDQKGYKWRANVTTLLNKLEDIANFESPIGAQYTGDTLFVGGTKSDYLPTKTDLAQTKLNKHIIDLAYASYQSTDSIFGKIKSEQIPTPLVIIHGLLGSKSNFNTLSKRYHNGCKPKRLVYAVDLRNHGDSLHLNKNSYDDLVMDVLKFLYSMNLQSVHLLGHDIGGRTAMLIALKYPELVQKLIITDISPITTSHQFKIIAEVFRILNNIQFPPNLPIRQAKAHVLNCLSRIVKNRELMMLVLSNLNENTNGSYTFRFNSKALLENFDEIASFPNVHNLKFDKSVLFVGGTKSDFIQKSDIPKILQLFPKAEFKYVEGAGHWVHAEKPNEFLKLTMDFLNRK